MAFFAPQFVPAENDYYGILQVSQHASTRVINAAYKELSDVVRGKQRRDADLKGLDKELALLKRSVVLLTNGKERALYDQTIYPDVLSKQQKADTKIDLSKGRSSYTDAGTQTMVQEKQEKQQMADTDTDTTSSDPDTDTDTGTDTSTDTDSNTTGRKTLAVELWKEKARTESMTKANKSVIRLKKRVLRPARIPRKRYDKKDYDSTVFVDDPARYKTAIGNLDKMKEELEVAIGQTEKWLHSLSKPSPGLRLKKSPGPSNLMTHTLAAGEAERREPQTHLKENYRKYYTETLYKQLEEERNKREAYTTYLREVSDFLRQHEFMVANTERMSMQ